jgi:RecB family endonuclease NucS
VLELKRDQTSDATIGQVLRYMGWVKNHLATPGEEVLGMVIARDSDDAMRYALTAMQNVELRLYEVRFELRDPGPLLGLA